MRKNNQHIEIVSTTSPGLSSMGRESRGAILKVLSRHYTKVGITIVNDISDLEALVETAPDLVFLGMKFIWNPLNSGYGNSKKIWLSEFLSERGIAVTGSQSVSHRLELNKPLAKQCVTHAGLATSKFFVAKVGQPLIPEQVPGNYPLFVKPTNRGGGTGIDSDSVVYNFSELRAKVGLIARNLEADSLIEKYLPGREFSVAILKKQNTAGYHVMPIELVAPNDEKGSRLLSSKVKSADAEQVREITDPGVRESLHDLAINAFRSIGGRDYGRIDVRMDEQGEPHFLEANLIPSLIDNYGSFPKACALNIGLSHEKMLLQIVDLGLMRSQSAIEIIEPIMSPAAVALSQA